MKMEARNMKDIGVMAINMDMELFIAMLERYFTKVTGLMGNQLVKTILTMTYR